MTRTLWDALCQIADRRGRKGRQYKLASLLGIAIAATLAGANDLRAIFPWGRRLKPEALRLLGIDDGVAPCHARCTISSNRSIRRAGRTLGKFALGEDRARHIAIDGKALKGSRRLDTKALHVLSAFAAELGTVIGDLIVEPDQNEIMAAMVLLKGLPLDGAIISGDAIFCQREICRHLRDGNGHYLFVVKDNQPQLKADIAESFGDFSPSASAMATGAPTPDVATADKTAGIEADQIIRLAAPRSRARYPERLRRVSYRDRQIELFFKWIKQNLSIKSFFGTSVNAVRTQIWIAVSVYVLIAILKKRLKLDASLSEIMQTLSVTLFENMPLDQLLANARTTDKKCEDANQLDLKVD